MEIVNKLVMIADADSYVRQLIGRFVTDAGYTVSFEADGYEALDNARKSPPMVLFADILLPRLDGLALCRLLKGDPATSEIVSVIVMSVLNAEERALSSGADAFLRKPLEKTRLLMALEKATSKRNSIA